MSQRNQNSIPRKARKTIRRRNGMNGTRSQAFDGSLSISNNLQKIPRQVGLILPDRYRTNLRFWKQLSFNFTASFVSNVRFRPTAAFDVDPTVGSTAMAGFAELATLYTSYRVLSSHIRVEAITTSVANPPTIIVGCQNTDPGAALSAANVIATKEQPYSQYKMLGLSGSPPMVISNKMSTEKIYGSKAVLFDDNFSSLVTSTPNNNWFWSICGYQTVFDPNLTWLSVTFEVDCEFYDRTFVQT